MNLTKKRLDNLKLFIFDSPKPAKGQRYNLLKVYKWVFGIESALGMRRISVSDNYIRPPSVLFRLYCLAITCILFYYTYCNITGILNQPKLTKQYNLIQDFTWHVLSAVILVKTVFMDGKTTVLLFEKFDEIDTQLNLLEGDNIFKISSTRNCFVLCIVCSSYAVIAAIWLAGGSMTVFRLHIVILMALGELQLMLCACLLSDVQSRLRNLKGQLIKRFSLRNDSRTGRKNTHLISCLCCGSYEAVAQEIKVTIELKDVVNVYENIMKAFHLTNSLFSMQVLLFFSLNFLNMLFIIWSSIILGFQKFSLTTFMASIGWCQRMTFAVFFPCYLCENITKDVGKLKNYLLSLLGEACHEEHHQEAASLLRYCDASEPRFSVYGLFNMNISLPFSFLQLVATHVIVLLQFSL